MHYGDRIRSLRTSKNITQAEMADIVGKSLSAYKLWESGDNEPSISSLVFMADYFGVTLDYLVARPTENERNAVTKFEEKIVTHYRGDYLRLIEAIQYSLDFLNFSFPDIMIGKNGDIYSYKIEAIKELVDSLNKIHALESKIEHERLYNIELKSTDNLDKICLNTNIVNEQVQILHQGFHNILKVMMKYILGLRIKSDI